MNAITVNGLTKMYKDVKAVDDLSFTVGEGEMFAFLGENGAGKSTTINILSTILQKTEGEVKIFDHVLGKDDDAIRNSIGIVFQGSVLDYELTVRENLFTRGAYYGLDKKKIAKRLEPFMDRFELKEIMNRKYMNLSGGQRRRVDIIRALLNKPRILFLDEPTTGLDPKSRKIVWDYIDYLRREKNLTIFLTTHYMEETKDADNVVILDKGKLIVHDTPSNLKSRYASSRLVWYTMKNPGADELLGSYESTYESDHYNVKFDKNITEFLYAHRDVITDYEVIKGSMDDVFLNLTGRTMEEK
ncbi:MAG: ABC transporter ATP-binding protein [Lachnospiraceae bacterium]|nr:ABC transporter ATP-binding protein [Lachnospiraceae bacterium]